jgi:serine/threonine-protein kinase RIO1
VKRKVLSPIENLSSTSNQMKNVTKVANSSFSKSPSFASPLPNVSGTSSSKGKNNTSGQKIVHLFGETIESVFRLNKRQHRTEEHYQLYRSIVDGSCTDDPGTWCRILELARCRHQDFKHITEDNNRSTKENIVRLHRLATLRFSLDRKELRTSSSSKCHKKHIFEIWLSYAKIHAKLGNLDEARRTYRCIEENESVLLDFSASPGEVGEKGSASVFYLAYANFESNYGVDKSRAQKILLRGIKTKAEPIIDLENALTFLTCNDDGCDEFTKRYRRRGTPGSEKKSEVALGSRKLELNLSVTGSNDDHSQAKRDLDNNVLPSKSPKRLNSLKRDLTSPQKFDRELQTDRTTNDVETNSANRKKVKIEDSSKVLNNSKHPIKGLRVLKETPTVPITTINRTKSQGKPPVKKNRPPLTSRLARKGLSGKAKRVDCSITVDDDDSSSDDETRHDEPKSTQKSGDLSSLNEPIASSIPSKSKSGNSSKVPSFKKLDLSYMWAWDPNKKEKDQNETANQNQVTEKSSDATNSSGSGQSTFNTHLTVIDTQGSGTSAGDSSNTKIIASKGTRKEGGQSGGQIPQSSSKKEDQKSVGVTKNKTGNVGHKKVESENGNSTTQVDESIMAKRQALVAKANLEFLPLVHEDNIIKVNSSTYAKLGVIGKGGSCKVYRALSKKCSVVAIKKVKLAGMDRKAIEGYANEISLLKRLRGNPAIIQMYDSEVDIQRKSIFVVMELGEVDLNNVLQQRALSETSRSLNMNFIRLTWQQMLSAVHCIHEERIIHSDLKPANFLFVRGALKLIDFGIAKAIVNDDTTNIYRENHIGTLNYMSPEAILDTGSGQDGPRMKIGRASDVWSLGCILYEMVYGKTPFYKLHFIQKLQAIVNPSHKIKFPEDDEAEAAIDAMKLCLCRNPEERPPIIGIHGLLNEHWFLHAKRQPR